MARVSSADSITQGPAIITSSPLPTQKSAICTLFANSIILMKAAFFVILSGAKDLQYPQKTRFFGRFTPSE